MSATCRDTAACQAACTNSCIPELDDLGLPLVPEIPPIPLCLHIPWTNAWYTHWTEFNKKAKDFHQAMIDFNSRMLEWYSLKSKQLDRFGTRHPYIAGTVVSGGRMTIIYAKAINDGEDCLKFTLYRCNEKININEAITRVYGSLKHSFIIGGIGGLVVCLLTGYFGRPPIYARRLYTSSNVAWLVIKRSFVSSILYTIVERLLLLKFSKPQKYLLSGSAGVICGAILGVLDECDLETTACGASEYGIFSFLCNAFFKNQSARGTVGGDTEPY